jgi:hypothetical protein
MLLPDAGILDHRHLELLRAWLDSHAAWRWFPALCHGLGRIGNVEQIDMRRSTLPKALKY